MKQHLEVPMELRREIDECVAMAQAATNNKLRAHHYATAQAYLQLYEAEVRAEDTNQPFLLDKCVATATEQQSATVVQSYRQVVAQAVRQGA